MMKPARAACRLAAVALLAALLGGCAIEPWVKPYERERLADPIMNIQRSTLIGQHREHVYDVREASRGATGVQGTGCGCN
ncbi:MAG TPA: DUF4266 domain-containing protein [Burkholderiaceae bacterium]|nr:DUF4266 domain-containing protein [Burkholderiaceae bacterium]